MIPSLGNEELWRALIAQGTQVGSVVQDRAWPGPPGSDSTMKFSTSTGSGPQWATSERQQVGYEHLAVISAPSIMFTSEYLLGLSG